MFNQCRSPGIDGDGSTHKIYNLTEHKLLLPAPLLCVMCYHFSLMWEWERATPEPLVPPKPLQVIQLRSDSNIRDLKWQESEKEVQKSASVKEQQKL